MTTQIKKEDTETLIKETAKRLIFSEGKFNTNTQDIADVAGINRSLINYYFRSRDNLITTIIEEAVNEDVKTSLDILKLALTFKEKIAAVIDYFFEKTSKYPYLELYLATSVADNCLNFNHEKKDQVLNKILKILSEELEYEIEKGNIKPIPFIHFYINLTSLIINPINDSHLSKILKINNIEHKKANILSERKQYILNALFKN